MNNRSEAIGKLDIGFAIKKAGEGGDVIGDVEIRPQGFDGDRESIGDIAQGSGHRGRTPARGLVNAVLVHDKNIRVAGLPLEVAIGVIGGINGGSELTALAVGGDESAGIKGEVGDRDANIRLRRGHFITSTGKNKERKEDSR